MALEKEVLLSIDINTNNAVKTIQELTKRMEEYKEEADAIAETEGKTSKAYLEKNAQVKAYSAEIKSQNKILLNYEKATLSTTGSIEQMRNELAVVSKEWAQLNEHERTNTEYGKKLTKQKKDLTDALKAEEKATGDTRRNVGNYTDSIKEAIDAAQNSGVGFGNMSGGIGKVNSAFNLLKANPIFAILAAFVGTLTTLYQALKRSEEGQNSINKVLAVGGSILNNFLDILTSVSESLVSVFSDPKQAIKDLGNIIQQNIINRFTGIIDTANAMGKILKGVFDMDMDAITEGTKEYGESVVQILTGVDDLYGKVTNSVKDFTKEVLNEVDATMALEDAKASLDKTIRENLVQNAKDEKEISLLREQSAEKDKYNAEQRSQFLNEAIALQDQILERQLFEAREKARIHAEELTFSASTKEDLEEQARLEAEIFKIEEQNALARKRFKTEQQTALNESITMKQEESQASIEIMNQEIEQWRILNKSKLDDNKQLNDELVAQEKARLDEQYRLESEALQAKKDLDLSNINLTESEKMVLREQYNTMELQQKSDLETQKDELDLTIKAQRDEQRLLDEELVAQRESESLSAQYEAQLAQNQVEYEMAMEAQNRLNNAQNLSKEQAEKKNNEITKRYAKAENDIKIQQASAQLGIAGSLASAVQTIAGEQSKVGKAAAIAGTTISTLQSSIEAYKSLAGIPTVGPALGAAAASAALVTGYATIRKITAVNTNSASGASGSGSTPSAPSAPSITVPSNTATANNQNNYDSVSANIGNGIVTRNNNNSQTENNTQTVLVVDDVTYNQNNYDEQNRISTL